MCVCVCVCACVCVRAYVGMYVCIYACMYVCMSTISNIFSSKTTEPIEANFHNGASLGWGNKNLLNGPGHMTKIAAMPRYGKNLKQNFFSRTQRPMTLKLDMQHWVLEYYQDCSNDNLGWPWPILRQCQIWSLTLLYGKCKIMDFSESIVVYDIKVGRYC